MAAGNPIWLITASLLLLSAHPVSSSHVEKSSRKGTHGGLADGSEEWGYEEVRKGAHMFWWLYHHRCCNSTAVREPNRGRQWRTEHEERAQRSEGPPLVIWLQGGPGASGTGFGNFGEIGPLDVAQRVRPTTWLQLAHLLFVDNPVGTGFSYVESAGLLTTTNAEIAADLVTWLAAFLTAHPTLRHTPLYIISESYGGKMAAEFALALHSLAQGGKLGVDFRGVALGDSWISPMSYVTAWGPLLKSLSLVDSVQAIKLDGFAQMTAAALAAGNLSRATDLWGLTEDAVEEFSDNVNFNNVLLHHYGPDAGAVPLGTARKATANSDYGAVVDTGPGVAAEGAQNVAVDVDGSGGHRKRMVDLDAETAIDDLLARGNVLGAMWRRHVAPLQGSLLSSLMNGPIRKKLGIVPVNVTWGGQSNEVFAALSKDFMKDVVHVVDALLLAGINVTVYNGQLDLICCSTGTEAWLQRLQWPQLPGWNAAKRRPLYVSGHPDTMAFVKRHHNLAFYWVLLAGHMVPSDNPEMALEMLSLITNTTATPRDWPDVQDVVGSGDGDPGKHGGGHTGPTHGDRLGHLLPTPHGERTSDLQAVEGTEVASS